MTAASPPSPVPAREGGLPSRPGAAAPTSVPVRIALAPTVSSIPAPPAPQAAPSDEALIRDAVQRYARAQSTLDVDLYESVYPALKAQRRAVEKAFADMRAQELDADVVSVDVSGTTARVKVAERRVITPKVGSPERFSREVSMQLEKRGGAWVITSLR